MNPPYLSPSLSQWAALDSIINSDTASINSNFCQACYIILLHLDEDSIARQILMYMINVPDTDSYIVFTTNERA